MPLQRHNPRMTLRYRIDVADTHAHLFRVTLTIAQPAEQQLLSLPVWIPGSYLVREFARHLSHLEARQGDRAVPLLQRDKATWEARCTGHVALTLSYSVYAFDTSVRAAWLDTQRGFFNGTGVFLRVQGRENELHELHIGADKPWPKGWSVATALTAKKVSADGRGAYVAANYDELVDHPVEMGRFWRGGFCAAGIPHEFVVAGALPGFDGERLLSDTKRICEAQIDFWHGRGKGATPPPIKRYVFLLNAVEDGYGGLEHRASTALLANRRDLPHTAKRGSPGLGDGYVTLLGLISHEYFHTWNVKRMRPADFRQVDYTQENYTELLWFFEGFTSYYDDLFLVRTGLIDEARYLKLLSKSVSQVLATPGRAVQSVAQASFDAWTKYYRPDENTLNATVSYYTKGAQVALALDLTLRSEGKTNLDQVMRTLWERSDGGPISEADVAQVLAHLGKRSFTKELAAWVHGTRDLPLQPLLQGTGVQWTHEAAPPATRLGARVNDTGGALKVQAVNRGGLAEQAGLAAGDELLAFNDWRLRKLDDLLLLGAFAQAGTLLVTRDQRLHTLALPADSAAARDASGAVALSVEAKPSAAVRKRRAKWLSQT